MELNFKSYQHRHDIQDNMKALEHLSGWEQLIKHIIYMYVIHLHK